MENGWYFSVERTNYGLTVEYQFDEDEKAFIYGFTPKESEALFMEIWAYIQGRVDRAALDRTSGGS